MSLYIHALYSRLRLEGHEGVIVKLLDAPWVGRRSYAYMKLKANDTEDLRVVDAVEGEGRLVGTLGKLIVSRPVPGGWVLVGVGTGFTDAERHELWAMHRADTLVGRTAEVGYNEVTPDGSLRHPVFLGLRIDK